MISLLAAQISRRPLICFVTLLFACASSANTTANEIPGVASIYATTLPTSESVSLIGINADGSLLLRMSESQLRGITASGLHGITASGLRDVANQAPMVVFEEIPLIALGPVAKRSDGEASISVLGQDVIFDSQTAVISFDANEPLPIIAEGTDAVRLLNEDDYIAVAGEIMGPAEHLGTVIIKLPEQYFDGISIAYVRSMTLAEQNSDFGIAQSGSTEIDYTGALHDNQLVPTSSGSVIEYFGFTATKDKMIASFSHNISHK